MLSDPDAPTWPAGDTETDVQCDTTGYLVWVAGVRGEAFANQLGAEIQGAEDAGLDWADVSAKAHDITVHGGHAGELAEAVRAWIRRGGTGARHRAVRLRREAPLAVARPAWCGSCNEATRMTDDDLPRRCPDCHPLTQRQEPA